MKNKLNILCLDFFNVLYLGTQTGDSETNVCFLYIKRGMLILCTVPFRNVTIHLQTFKRHVHSVFNVLSNKSRLFLITTYQVHVPLGWQMGTTLKSSSVTLFNVCKQKNDNLNVQKLFVTCKFKNLNWGPVFINGWSLKYVINEVCLYLQEHLKGQFALHKNHWYNPRFTPAIICYSSPQTAYLLDLDPMMEISYSILKNQYF